jgi:16S rRNA processing protein RimM
VDRPTVVVGVVAKAHGIRGEVSVQNRSDNPDRWGPDALVFDRDGTPYRVREVRPHGAHLLVRFEGVDDRDAAEALRGRELLVPRSWLPSLPEGEWWPDQIQGCRVVTEGGRDLGAVTEIVANPANDLWVTVDASGTQTLIPVLAEVVVDVDVDAERIVVREVAGLTAPDDPADDPRGG